VSRIVAFIIKNINMIILFPCTVGCLDSSGIEIKEKIKAQSFKNYLSCLGWCEYQHAHAILHALTRATILGTLCTLSSDQKFLLNPPVARFFPQIVTLA